MKAITRLSYVFVLVFLFSSCGVITKTRYGNGLKLNVELNVFKKDDAKSERTVAKARTKKTVNQSIAPEAPMGITQNGQEAITGEGLTIAPVQVGSVPEKKSIKGKVRQIKREVRQVKKMLEPLKVGAKDQGGPIEPHAKIGGILFYGSLLITIFSNAAGVALSSGLGTVLSLFLLIGFILAIISLHKIRMSGGAYGGYGLALSIVIIGGLYILFLLAVIILFAALLGAL